MQWMDLTLDSPEENLALDEVLLEQAEACGQPGETLRVWESRQQVAVLGRSSRVDEEVDRQQCAARDITILRRCSGGATVLIGPGCLMYSVVLSLAQRPELRMVEHAHGYVLGRMVKALSPVLADKVQRQGISDLTVGDQKFSGNSLRCKRTHLLYHGTLLYQFPLDLLTTCLRTPPRQPDYRAGRTHRQFVTNLTLSARDLRERLFAAWSPDSTSDDWPREETQRLVQQRYATNAWNLRR
jgi:lipoate-protein ligase A